MIYLYKRSLLLMTGLMSFGLTLHAQNDNEISIVDPWKVDTLIKPVPLNRQLFTDRIDKEIVQLDLIDGRQDNKVFHTDATSSELYTEYLMHQLPLLKIHVENLSTTHASKQRYHKAIERLAKSFLNMSWANINPHFFGNSIQNLEGMIKAIENNQVDEFVKENSNIFSLNNSDLLSDYPTAQAYVFEKLGKEQPELMIKRLPSMVDKPYADATVAAAAKIMPGTILSYALSTSNLSAAVKRNQDPLVKTIVSIANQSRNSLKALPFIGDIHNGRKTIQEIDAFADDDVIYFKNLVHLLSENEQLARNEIENEIEYRSLQFVRVINELHNERNEVRFKSIQVFTPEELYVMMIGGQDEIYTSSFTSGTYKLMLEKLSPMSGDELLDKVHRYHFRTFIRMCAGFNTLQTFFKTFSEEKKIALMKDFVSNLELGGPNDLEDAVDVADAFGSIDDKELSNFLIKEVKANYERTYKANNQQSKKGVVVYGLLSTIFNSSENSSQLTDDLSVIPPITYLPESELKDEEQTVVQQIFFYGDDDGKVAYNNYLTLFSSKQWDVKHNQYWSTFTSKTPNKVVIYANKPLTEPEDETAQKALHAYLQENDVHPSIIIHRGHSYFLNTTLSYLTPDVKIVMLGSCGGYHNLANVLDNAPDAHIISSKQIGALNINVPIIKAINDRLLEGKDINWVDMWKDLGKYFSTRSVGEKDLFSDYIPPNKNLGAIFIKAYRKIAGNENWGF